jgi:hypothetical protein
LLVAEVVNPVVLLDQLLLVVLVDLVIHMVVMVLILAQPLALAAAAGGHPAHSVVAVPMVGAMAAPQYLDAMPMVMVLAVAERVASVNQSLELVLQVVLECLALSLLNGDYNE